MAAEEQDASIIRVMLVDDSAVVRGLMSRALQQDPRIHIVATANDGDMAINVLQRNPVDVIILDVEMPKKDGLEALPILLAMAPNTHVIMASSLTQRNASISMRAMEMGAADYIPKPTSRGDEGAIQEFYRELKEKVIQLGEAAKRKSEGILPMPALASGLSHQPVIESRKPPMEAEQSTKHATIEQSIKRASSRPLPGSIHAVAIASSTGGPQALIQLLSKSNVVLKNVPVFITQHMPATFTTLLAEHLSADSGLPCKEAVNGELVSNGTVYVAPGDYHMLIEPSGDNHTIRLTQDPPVNFCRPAADPMLKTLAKCYGNRLFAIVLTGMGNDGAGGAKEVKDHGGYVAVQDKESSVVWGMPGAVVAAGNQDEIMPVDDIAARVNELVRR